MKAFILTIILFLALVSCRQHAIVVDARYLDSLMTHYTPSRAFLTNEGDLQFWRHRSDSMGDFVSREHYARALATRFHLSGDIRDLQLADSLMNRISRQYPEPGFLLSLAGYSMLQHQFVLAKKYIDTVLNKRAEPFASQMMLFDVQYELGNYYDAGLILKNYGQPSDYAYNFRLSKLDHYSGSVDSAVAHMLKAAALVPSNPYLKQAALSNAADLYVHDAELEKAAALYKECLSINPADFHSLMGLGWLALVGDANDSLAVRCFLFAADHLRSPDPYFKLARATEHRNPLMAKKYAREFADKASQSMYGDMYNKYLIELYCGILHTPEKALPLAKREIEVRPTAQAYAALAWTLYSNGLSTKAIQTYEGFVSGKGLEGLELYWMGKMMKGRGKGFNAVRFFKAAHKNRFDLSPAMQRDLDAQLH